MKAIIYIHGKGGTSEEAKHYEVLFPEYKVFCFDYDEQMAFLDNWIVGKL